MNEPNIATCVFLSYLSLRYKLIGLSVLQAFRQRRLADSGAEMGYGGNALWGSPKQVHSQKFMERSLFIAFPWEPSRKNRKALLRKNKQLGFRTLFWLPNPSGTLFSSGVLWWQDEGSCWASKVCERRRRKVAGVSCLFLSSVFSQDG